MTSAPTTVTLNTGVLMPALGLGVYQIPPEDTADVVATALQTGYRLIDTAAGYFNETEVGEGIRRSGINRAEIFVETKLWVTDYGYDEALHGFEKSARKLRLDRIDLLLLHQPLASNFHRTVAAYRALETLLSDGRVAAIGVANQSPKELETLIDLTGVVPAVNQIQVHPYYSQPSWRAANHDHGVLTQSWSPIGGSYTYGGADKNPLHDPVITALADKYGKTPAQIMLRWHLDHGFSAIPKSVKPQRLAENHDVFDFTLTPEEVASVDGLDTGVRGGPDPDSIDESTLGREIPEA